MKTVSKDIKKILALLQSSDEKNRLLGFQLMESQGIQAEVAAWVNHTDLFHFLTTPLAVRTSPLFFFYEGEVFPNYTLYVIRNLEAIDLNQYLSSELARQIPILVVEFNQKILVKAMEEEYTRVILEETPTGLNLGLSWRITSHLSPKIEQNVALVQEWLSKDQEAFKDVYKTTIIDSRKATQTEDTWDWLDIARKLLGFEFSYAFKKMDEVTVQFSVLIRFPLIQVR